MTARGGVFAPLLVLFLIIGTLGISFHHHGELYSQRVCPVCVTASHQDSQVEETFQGLPGPLESRSFQFVDPLPKVTGLVGSVYTRSPPIS